MIIKSQKPRIAIWLVSTVFLYIGIGCDKSPAMRQHQEVLIEPQEKKAGAMDDPHAFLNMMPQDEIHSKLSMDDPQMQKMLSSSVVDTPLAWQVPQGWQEQKGSSMRLATFVNMEKDSAIECTIISLGGSAGGLKQNVIRWIQQIQLNVPSDEALDQFISRQNNFTNSSGLSVQLIDLTGLQNSMSDDTPSMMVGIIDIKSAQVFVKVTGSKKSINDNRERFLQLIESIHLKEQ